MAVWPITRAATPRPRSATACIVLEDTDGDGRADRSTTFLDDLNARPVSSFIRTACWSCRRPTCGSSATLTAMGERTGKERVLMGRRFGRLASHRQRDLPGPGRGDVSERRCLSSDPGRDRAGPVRNNDAAIYRFEPRTGRFETYIAYGFANPHGRVFDYWGNDLVDRRDGQQHLLRRGDQRAHRLPGETRRRPGILGPSIPAVLRPPVI